MSKGSKSVSSYTHSKSQLNNYANQNNKNNNAYRATKTTMQTNAILTIGNINTAKINN